jgi:hypothetical protein
MHVGRNNQGFDYYMNGVKLTVVEEEKDVGITVQNNLKPAKHCQRVAATAMEVLKQLAKNFHYRDKKIFLKLYMQYVRPHVEFATPAWSLVTLAKRGHTVDRTSAGKGSRHDFWSERGKLRGKMQRTGH